MISMHIIRGVFKKNPNLFPPPKLMQRGENPLSRKWHNSFCVSLNIFAPIDRVSFRLLHLKYKRVMRDSFWEPFSIHHQTYFYFWLLLKRFSWHGKFHGFTNFCCYSGTYFLLRYLNHFTNLKWWHIPKVLFFVLSYIVSMYTRTFSFITTR